MVSIIINPDILRRLMDQQHYTNARLAEETKLSEGTVKRLLKGCPTTYVTASLLSATLGVTVDELISDETAVSDQEETVEMTAEEALKMLEKIVSRPHFGFESGDRPHEPGVPSRGDDCCCTDGVHMFSFCV